METDPEKGDLFRQGLKGLPDIFFSNIIEIVADAILMVDENQRILLFNKGAEKIFGYNASEAVGQPLDLLLPPRLIKVHRQHIRAFGAGTVRARLMGERTGDLFGRRKDGTEFFARISIAKLTLGGQTFFIAILHDISNEKRAEETIHRLAYYDSLTGLPNRLLFRDLIGQAIPLLQEERKTAAIFLIDLNQFKEINDTLGHPRGDILLQGVGQRLRTALRPTDTVARLGGDEFGLLLPLKPAENAALVARKILKALEKPFEIEGLPIEIEPSIGIALYPEHGESAESLMQKADVAMYASKRQGAGYTLYASDLDPYSPRRLAMMGELRRALEENQLFLVYQPKIDLQTGQTMGVEALIRWQHREWGMIPPGQFIPAAEKTALIGPLTQFVLHEALRQHRRWYESGWELNIAVNLSARNLQDPDLEREVIEALQTHGVASTWLELEITEGALMADPEKAIKTIQKLCQKGISFSIDDFGVGYSSLSHLKRLPVKSLKIDQSFVKDMMTDHENAAIVRSIIELGRNLGRKVVAEGVEDEATLRRLTALGCAVAQGYYICRPISAADLTRWFGESPFPPPLH